MATSFIQCPCNPRLTKKAELLQTPAVALTTNDEGAVCGAITQSGDTAIQLNAKGVILASSHADNPDIINARLR